MCLLRSVSILIAVMMSAHVAANNDKFSYSAPFFKHEKYVGGEFQPSTRPTHCPDGSKLVVSDFGFFDHERDTDAVSCIYASDQYQLVIEHSWEGDSKISEYSTIDDKRFGPFVSRSKKFDLNVVKEYCDDKIIRYEIYSKNNEIIMVSLHMDGEKSPSVILDVNNPSNSKNISKLSKFTPCNYEKFGIKNKTFNKWLMRDWHPLKNN